MINRETERNLQKIPGVTRLWQTMQRRAIWTGNQSSACYAINLIIVRRLEAHIVSQAEYESYCEPLIGHQLLSIKKKDYSWFFVFGEEVSLVTESPWRLISEERIIVASQDHGQQFGLPKPVDAAEGVLLRFRSHRRSSGDLCVLWRPNHRVQRAGTSPAASDILRIRVVAALHPPQRDHLHGRREHCQFSSGLSRLTMTCSDRPCAPPLMPDVRCRLHETGIGKFGGLVSRRRVGMEGRCGGGSGADENLADAQRQRGFACAVDQQREGQLRAVRA